LYTCACVRTYEAKTKEHSSLSLLCVVVCVLFAFMCPLAVLCLLSFFSSKKGKGLLLLSACCSLVLRHNIVIPICILLDITVASSRSDPLQYDITARLTHRRDLLLQSFFARHNYFTWGNCNTTQRRNYRDGVCNQFRRGTIALKETHVNEIVQKWSSFVPPPAQESREISNCILG
jgi:hypothetical protein